jgi:II/X family phage/plasmid replication protein
VIDTLKLVSPQLPAETVAALVAVSVHRYAVDNSTGEELWSFTSGELEGSFDHRVRFNIRDNSIVIEGSVHKLLLGHNIFGGSDDLQACARFIVEGISSRLGVVLPPADFWNVHQIDEAGAYLFPGFDAVEGYFRALQGVSYPRRKVSRHAFQSIHVPGRLTTVKLYHKGVEFSVHDRKRLRKQMLRADLDWLQNYANSVLRSEVSLRRRLVEDFGHWPLVSEIPEGYAKRVHDSELARLVREGKAEMETVRTFLGVKERLHEIYTPRNADLLLGTWMQLSAMGEAETRKGKKRATFFLHRKQLLEAGCSWHSSDIHQGAQLFPIDFVPVSSSPYAITGEHENVKKLLDPFRAA